MRLGFWLFAVIGISQFSTPMSSVFRLESWQSVYSSVAPRKLNAKWWGCGLRESRSVEQNKCTINYEKHFASYLFYIHVRFNCFPFYLFFVSTYAQLLDCFYCFYLDFYINNLLMGFSIYVRLIQLSLYIKLN